MDRLFLQEIVLSCAVGVTAAERRRRQALFVDLDLYFDASSAARSDDPRKTIDYRNVLESVQGIVAERQFKLIEAVADRLATGVLEQFAIERIRVRVVKPQALIDQGVGKVGIEIERSQ